MRRLTCLAFVACHALSSAAWADSGDFQLYKLGNPASTDNANAHFRIFANQLGAAISSFNLSPPETLGHSGFNVAFEYVVAQIDKNPSYWPTESGAPSNLLLMPTIHLRKGLPFSFELGTKVTYLQNSRMASATVEVKWALNEGLTYFPDLGVRGYGTHLFGARDFSLTTTGLDLGLGKQFALGGMLTLTPYVGWNLQYVTATSNVVDFEPDRSLSEAIEKPTDDTGVFSSVQIHQNHNNRFYVGLRFISYVFEVAAEASVINTVGVRLADGSTVKQQVLVFGGKVGIDF
ncbi:MAG: hypothetical protein HY901_06045 [Deltaproteobacteria bacterium]|nr:hypothetical protein [Deltaproteobacteria bacterium]